jgi:hypothetical protein
MDSDGTLSPKKFTREQVQRLADFRAARANKKDRLKNFWHGEVYASDLKRDGKLYWRISVAGHFGR